MHLRKVLVPFLFVLALGAVALPLFAHAHEVYVLDKSEIAKALVAPRPDFADALADNLGQLILWAGISIVVVFGVFFISITRPLERLLDPWLIRLKRYAPAVTQATLGAALLASGWYNAAFGVELPFADAFGVFAPWFRWVFALTGACILLGLYPRVASVIALAAFMPFIAYYGWYMLNYGTYFGEAIAVALFGGGYGLVSLRMRGGSPFAKEIENAAHKYKFLVLRLAFGASLVYASLYAKYTHGALALETVHKYDLTRFFPFDPLFLVFGAMVIEILLGLFFAFGFEVRFTALFFLVFLSLSVWFFGEAVWPHIILIGTAAAMFLHGYDRYTLTARLTGRSDLEPVL